MLKLLLTFISSLGLTSAYGAACCGGGGAGANIIVGDYQSYFSLGLSYSSVIGDQAGSSRPVFWSDERKQRTYSYKLGAATMLANRFQVGAATEFLSKRYAFNEGASESSHLMGDTHFFAAYEVMTESFYSSWKPRLFISLTHGLPTGNALEEATKDALSDVSGVGRHQTQLGLHFFKRTRYLLLSTKGELYHRFQRSFHSDLSLGSSQGGSLEVGALRTPPKARFSYGLFIRGIWHGKKSVHTSERHYTTPTERVFEVAPYAGYALDDDWALDFIYTDQTLLGPVKNTTLSRTFSLAINKYIPL